MAHDDLFTTVLECMTVLNEQRLPDQRVVLESESVLVGDGGVLDSLALVSLLVMIEENVEDKFGGTCSLVDSVFNENSEDRSWTVGDLVTEISKEVVAL